MDLGRFGVWRRGAELSPDLAREVERLGYATLWVGGSPTGDLDIVEELLDATTFLTLATGVVNLWRSDATTVASSFHRLEAAHPGRFLLGVGVGHPESVAGYRSPYSALVAYLDDLDAAGVPPQRRVLGALGPRVVGLAGERALGAHPYLVPSEHSRRARALLGPERLLAPEHLAVIDPDPVRARARGRSAVAKPYLELTNYRRNLLSLGFDAADLADGGSDRLVDALVAHGGPEQVATRLAEHLGAGADHVAIQLLAESEDSYVAGLAALAQALPG
ncbi:MAG TPA: LLM class F420-dependent oxidoreductase [Actinomycetes bacterium]|nr:LLM class F420-dependent oxidoreductase [Actinomycetes bacterium]